MEPKAPFPYFGGKSLAGDTVWHLLGECQNYVEPFAGSLAVLFARPSPVKGPETVNDFSAHVANVWRAMRADPEALAERCLGPVCEVNTEAEHYALVYGEPSLRDHLGDPEAYNLDAAAWWIMGACNWIGSGWASGEGPWQWSRGNGWQKRGDAGNGVNRQLPHLGDAGKGVNRKLPHLGNAGKGVNRKLPHLGDAGKGVNRKLPHLGDAGTGELDLRRAFLLDWFGALSDRLSGVRIACGDFERVLGHSVTTKHAGVTAVFLDPPYASTGYVYGESQAPVSERVRAWCIDNGEDPKLRIVLAGRGAEHDDLCLLGWSRVEWRHRGGYSGKAPTGADQEVLWASPNCFYLSHHEDHQPTLTAS